MRMFVALLLLLTFTTSSSATYCICKDGTADHALQTSIDYACGTLADCKPILDKGACYEPNTLKSHCNWAVNSYFQNAGQVDGSCNFSETATTSQNPPPNLVTGCIYPSSLSSAGSLPSTTPPPKSPGTPPASGPSSGASTLVISSVFTLCFSSLAFLM